MRSICAKSAVSGLVAVLCLLLFLVSPRASFALVTQWDFDGSLESNDLALPLIAFGPGGAQVPDDPPLEFELFYQFEEVDIGGESAEVVHFERGTYFWVQPGVAANGGGAYVNQYTLIMDVMFPDRSPSGGWGALYQTNDTNSNDGDWFVNPADGVGIGGNYGGSVPQGEWRRLALVVDLVAGTYTSYVDGEQVQQNTGEAIDGRYSLYSLESPGAGGDGFFIFADENGDDAEGFVNSVQFLDSALPGGVVALYGGPSAEGIPEPPLCAFRGFTVEFDAASGTVTGSWSPLPGDEGFRVFQGDRQIGGDLPADASTFEDSNAPLGGVDVVYTLRSLRGGEVDLECESGAVQTFVCISNAQCCPDQAAESMTVSWDAAQNVDVTGYRVSRDGAQIATVDGAETSYADPSPGAGTHRYEITALSGAVELCTIACSGTVTGIEISSSNPCGGVLNQYDFEGDLTSSTGGRDLLPEVSAPLDPAFDVPGISFEEMEINGELATVARYTRGTILKMLTGLGPNGGGTYTNQYTLIMDVLFEAGALDASTWAPFYNTNATNSNDGDWFVNSAGGIGIGGNYGGFILDEDWHRLALVVDLVAGTYTSYVDGEQVQQNTGEGLDGRFSLYTVNDDDLGIHLFADDNAENAEGLVSSVQIRDVAVSGSEIAAFGKATAGKIPVLPPCLSNLLCVVDQASKSVTLDWNPGTDTPGTAIEIARDGAVIDSVALDVATYSDGGLAPGVYRYTVSIDDKDAGCPPLSCRVEIIEDGFIFYDGFDQYADDAELAAGGWQVSRAAGAIEDSDWTVENPAGERNPPSFDGEPSNGKFVISRYDGGGNIPGSGMSYDLVSPTFSTAGVDTVWLHMDLVAQLNNEDNTLEVPPYNATAVFEVDVSTDSGANWTNLFQRVSPGRQLDADGNPLDRLPEFGANVDGFFGRLHLDLSSVAAGEADVRVRLRHYEPTSDWFIAIDHFLVDSNAATGGDVEVMSTEAFDGGIPDDWNVVSGPGSDTFGPWTDQDACSLSLLTLGGEFPDLAGGQQLHWLDDFFALADPFCSNAIQDEFLITPAFNMSTFSEVYLHFDSAVLATDIAVAEVLVSLDGGGTFEDQPLFSYNGGGLSADAEDPFYGEYVLAAPTAAGESDVAFAFHYETATGGALTGSWWAIDNVRITATSGGGGNLFRRGDDNGDGAVDVSDPITNLSFQFLGITPPNGLCLDALDFNDDGKVDVTDPIASLSHQFLGQDPPPTPGKLNCGADPTPDDRDSSDPPGGPNDELGCESYPQEKC